MLVTKCFRNLLFGFILAFSTNSLFASEQPWIEVDSPNFRVLTDGSEHDARQVAYEFEQIRAALVAYYPTARIETGAPLLILAVHDEESAMELAPSIRKEQKKGVIVGGLFQHRWEKQFAVIRLDINMRENSNVVYHEYTHTVMDANFRWLPSWLDEGMAEFFGNSRFESDKIYVGAPSPRYRVLQSQSPIPIDKLLSSPQLRDRDDLDIFYAESSALVHFLYFGPGMANGEKLYQFIDLLQKGTAQKKAFETIFGDSAALDKSFNEYVHRSKFTAGILNSPPKIDQKSFQLKKLSIAETDAQLGSYHLWSQDREKAKKLIETAIKKDPSLGLAHEDMGFLYFEQGKDEEARGEFSKAYELDSSLFLSLYYKTMLDRSARSDSPADQENFRQAMLNTLKLNPGFAPAYVGLSFLNLRQGKNIDALAAALKAEKLEPTRAGYRILSGLILLRLGRGKDASDFARYVAERWVGPDHDEAVELWSKVPEAQRTPGDALSVEVPKDVKILEGRVRSTTCGDKDQKFAVVIDSGKESLTFHSSAGFMSGFSDTLWYGADHFTACYHLDGMRAVVQYKPSADKNYAGDLVKLEYRLGLPEPSAAKPENTPQNTK